VGFGRSEGRYGVGDYVWRVAGWIPRGLVKVYTFSACNDSLPRERSL
jgi:hypothetical protein